MDTNKSYPGARSESHVVIGNGSAFRMVDTGNESDGLVRFSVVASSEFPVERFGVFGKWREVLDHSPDAVQMDRFASGRAAALEEHRGSPIGVIDKAWLDNGKLRVEGRFSRNARAQEVAQDFLDGIRSNVSIGYMPKRAMLIEENNDAGDLWRVTQWEPVEVSFVGVPADPTVGAGRNGMDGPYPSVIIEGYQPKEDRSMKQQDNNPVVNENNDGADIARREIMNLGEQFGFDVKTVREWLDKKMSVEQVQRSILESRVTDPNARASASAESLIDAGMNERDLKGYSYTRALMLGIRMQERDTNKPDGVEGEVHRYLRSRMPIGHEDRGGIMLPLSRSTATRALDSKTSTKGAELIQDQRGELIELLRNRSALLNLGAQSLTGLTAPVSFPKHTGAQTAYWVSENPGADVTSSDISLGVAQLVPKTLQATTAWSRQLLLTSSIDAENLVLNDLARVHALAIDFAGIHGLGAAGQPTGIYKALNVSSTAVGGALSYAKILAMQGQVASQNADFGALGWLMNPTTATNLKGVPRFANTDTPVWEGTYEDGRVGGYRAVASNQISKSLSNSDIVSGGTEIGNIFGNWNDLIFGFWGGFEIIIDPYSLKKRGMYEGTSFQLVDTLVRHGESFSKSTGATS